MAELGWAIYGSILRGQDLHIYVEPLPPHSDENALRARRLFLALIESIHTRFPLFYTHATLQDVFFISKHALSRHENFTRPQCQISFPEQRISIVPSLLHDRDIVITGNTDLNFPRRSELIELLRSQ
jgi:hypothetical protein